MPNQDQANPTTTTPDDAIRSKIVWILRAAFLVLSVVVLALGIVTGSTNTTGLTIARYWWLALCITLIFFVVVVAVDLLTPRRKLSAISALLFGTFAGLLATLVLSFVIDVFSKTYELDVAFAQPILTIKVLLGLGLSYLGITTVLQTQDDFRLVIPYVEFAKQYRGSRPFLLDTSVLIDARITEIARTGIFTAPILIPRFVIAELQTLADAQDQIKRAKGRRGLDTIAQLQRAPELDVAIDDAAPAGIGVDQRLVHHARAIAATLVTTDSALSKVAAINDVQVLNLHELALAMRSLAATGDRLSVRVARRGEQAGQGVGYLDDGTMVVVEQGESLIGQNIETVVTSAIQTANGRMIFASPANAPTPAAEQPKQDAPTPTSNTPAPPKQPPATPTNGASDHPAPPREPQGAPDPEQSLRRNPRRRG
ncbi:MAG: hypothetical protein KDA28_14535 [Phycisphaerales bacterium]|nr:hypothetical protein [Phycisphaerales bacterium]